MELCQQIPQMTLRDVPLVTVLMKSTFVVNKELYKVRQNQGWSRLFGGILGEGFVWRGFGSFFHFP